MPESRTSCWSVSQKNKDPYLKAWIDDIPPTTCEKAVWEYDRTDKLFRPYKWDGLQLNPSVPAQEVDLVFRNIRAQLKEHPYPTFQKFILWYVFLVHLPLVGIAVTLFVSFYSKADEHKRSSILTVYLSFIFTMTFALVFGAIYGKVRYSRDLKQREKDLEKLLDAISVGLLTRYQIRAVGGKCGAWVELQFLSPDHYMVMAHGNHHLPAFNQPVPPAFSANNGGYNPFNNS